METNIIKLDKNNIDIEKIKQAATIIKAGGLVAFPTETVYGLGANALDEAAVKSIFKAKGRPSDNPLIVHLSERGMLSSLVKEIPYKAEKLMNEFWPGPLTIIMKKSEMVPPIITANLDTVAIRIPSHPVALSLIEYSGTPIAAPSANISGRPSPTNASHVIEDLFGKIDVILDAGSAKVGLESTVIDVTTDPPMILRPGGITPLQIGQAIGEVITDPAISNELIGQVPRSPGMKYKHYSPKADVIIVRGETENIVNKINRLVKEKTEQGYRVGVLATEQTKAKYIGGEVISVGDNTDLKTVASGLFNTLRNFDEAGVQIVYAEAFKESDIGIAIMNRMKKAAGYKIIEV